MRPANNVVQTGYWPNHSPILQLSHYLRGDRAPGQQINPDLAGFVGFRQWLEDCARELPALLSGVDWQDDPTAPLCGGRYSGLTGVLSSLVRYKSDDPIFLESCWEMLQSAVDEPCLKRAVQGSQAVASIAVKRLALGPISVIFLSHPFASATVSRVLAWTDAQTLKHAFRYCAEQAENTRRICFLEHARYCYRDSPFIRNSRVSTAIRDDGPSAVFLVDRNPNSFRHFVFGKDGAFAELYKEEKDALAFAHEFEKPWIRKYWKFGFRGHYENLVEQCRSYSANNQQTLAAKQHLQAFLIERLAYYRSMFEQDESILGCEIYTTLTGLLAHVHADRATAEDLHEVGILNLEAKLNPSELVTDESFTAAQAALEACLQAQADGPLKQQAQALLVQAHEMRVASLAALEPKLAQLHAHVNAEPRVQLREALEAALPNILQGLKTQCWNFTDKEITDTFRSEVLQGSLGPVFTQSLPAPLSANYIRDCLESEAQYDRLSRDLELVLWRQHEDCRLTVELTRTLQAVSKALAEPNPQIAGAYLKHHAMKVQGRPSRGWKILGGILMALGACLCAAGVVIATLTAIPTLGVGVAAGIKLAAGGVAVSSLGASLFYGSRRKGLSRSVDRLRVGLSKR